MRTLLFLLCGYLLAGACYLLVRLFSAIYPAVAMLFPALFTLMWFAVSLTNLIAGMTQAGYSFGEELPLFLLIFMLPVATLYWLGKV
ncbi:MULTISPECIES: hypothetical protein [Pantoea]|uniref:Uncharacterized protein n=1 Tax=Candidatus Pantoea floridensis TaxID=1938870 RepID=A0A286DMA1_9GAMM|nr:hypothetical protein [Pantoea floridensis]PIF14700.1 hypothetical protein BX596_3799 [Enterobacteriaceae bacterium JKS000233]SOD59750.1 hypothetical protein SAMN06273570_4415 [Pantoea floridensis]